jgi:hypothetical protein
MMCIMMCIMMCKKISPLPYPCMVPLCVQATAGLRLLSEAVAEELLDEVGKRIVPYLHVSIASNNQRSLGNVTHCSI